MLDQDLLIEIGTEELPPKNLLNLISAFANNVKNELEKAEINYKQIKTFATPRRLALIVEQLANKQNDQIIEKRGPALNIAFEKDGKPTLQTIGFAKSCKINVKKLEKIVTDKGSWIVFKHTKIGESTKKLLPKLINQALSHLPIPKQMRWGDGEIAFVRPVHWVVLLYGDKPINTTILGVKTSAKTYGHRFHSPKAIKINNPSEYESILGQHYVIADFHRRQEKIRAEILEHAKSYGTVILNEELLHEVTSLTEWPVILIGSFAPRFLNIPEEVLITVLQKQQRCFPIIKSATENHGLVNYFVIISNISSKDPARVVKGNERVINARLNDAEFFFSQDQKKTLKEYLPNLKGIVFQEGLGDIYEKTLRLNKLSAYIAEKIGADIEKTKRASILTKADLATGMVNEFPEVQGIMGYYYAKLQHEPDEIALAIKEHYLPRFAKDKLPKTKISCTLAIADRIDTLVGVFGINKAPTGESDPFGLRRAALGIIRIILENFLELNLCELIEFSKSCYAIQLPNQSLVKQTLDFILERLRNWYLEKNISVHVFNAVTARSPRTLTDFDKRIWAVNEFQKLPEAEPLTIANKRVDNILQKSGLTNFGAVKENLLIEKSEQDLAKLILSKEKEISNLCLQRDYTKALSSLADIKNAIDNFFDNVMVMTDNRELCNNRLALLNQLRNLFINIADISLLQVNFDAKTS